jgi:hypothetical protein
MHELACPHLTGGGAGRGVAVGRGAGLAVCFIGGAHHGAEGVCKGRGGGGFGQQPQRVVAQPAGLKHMLSNHAHCALRQCTMHGK